MLYANTPRARAARPRFDRRRRGIVAVLSAFLLVVLFAFVAFAVDTGRMSLARTQLQNAADAASLAASQEISAAIQSAGDNASSGADANSIAIDQARQVAFDVALANGVWIDKVKDVRFGKRSFDEGSGKWPITWDVGPYNVVQVNPRRDNPDLAQPDGRLPLSFGWAVGLPSVEMGASSTAFVEARDLVLVFDFSGSMSDDSTFSAIGKLGQSSVEANMEDIYAALELNLPKLPLQPEYLRIKGATPPNGSHAQVYVTFKYDSVYVESNKQLSNVVLGFSNGQHYKFDDLRVGNNATFAGVGSNAGRQIVTCWVKSGANSSGDGPGYGERFDDTVANVRTAFGLDNVPYPYPSGSWNAFINRCRTNSAVRDAGYRHMYGGILFVEYLLREQMSHSQTPDLWRTPHYPFHAVKEGASLFLDYLKELDFGDEVGMVSYDELSRVETVLNYGGANVDISSDPITKDLDALDQIQRHKQAGHYHMYTAIGYGVRDARELLDSHRRAGARPTILLMTDGQANRSPNNFSLPSNWNWNELFDFDGDGNADYTTGDRHKRYALWEAKKAVDAGVTIHTLSVGAGGDRDLMQAIAWLGGGIMIDVPGGSTVAEMQEQLLAAFAKVAAKVPPPKLVYAEE